MKALKLLIFSLLFVAGQQAVAQNAVVNNNHPTIAFDIFFDFGGCGGVVATSTPPLSSTVTPYPAPCPLVLIKVVFWDVTCSTPTQVPLTIPFTANPTYYRYRLCDGTVVSFRVSFNGIDYTVDII